MRTIDALPAANAAPMVDRGVRSRLAANAIIAFGMLFVVAGIALATGVALDLLPDRQLTCAALAGAAGALLALAGLRIRRERAVG